MGEAVEGEKGIDSVLDAWRNNSVRALSADDATLIRLSGPKVDSFMRNIWPKALIALESLCEAD